MVITIKNRALKKKVFSQMDKFDKRALSEYKKGNMIEGRRLEKKSDKLYDKNYNKIFKIIREK